MNAEDIRLMEAPDALCLAMSYKADALARERAYDAAGRVTLWAYEATDPAERRALSSLASELEDVDTLLRWADADASAYGERSYDVVEEILRPIVHACWEVR